MLYIKINSQDAAFHFSVEEYLMEHFSLDQPLFMIWQADKCAMLGAYQVAQAEIDLNLAKEAEIQIVRRQSGGGTIFTDLGALLYTFILPNVGKTSVQINVRESLAAIIISALKKLGIPAEMAGRNDIVVEGKKVSGLAQYARKDRMCTHGSLLYNANLDMLADVLRVDDEKIRSKAIPSVRSRVANLSEYMNSSVSTLEFWSLLEQKLAEEWVMKECTLSTAQLQEVDKIYHKKFSNPDWTYGSSPKFSFRNNKRFPGGKVEIFLDVVSGVIAVCTIRGDFLGTVPIRDLELFFLNQDFRYEAINATLAEVNLLPYLGDISKEQFLSCMFD